MIKTLTPTPIVEYFSDDVWPDKFYKVLWHLFILGLLAYCCRSLWQGGADPAFLAWMLYVIGIVAICIQPRYGIYLIMFFGLVGDSSLSYWYPFVKNFSSGESILFTGNALIFSPLESYLGLTIVSWLARAATLRKFSFRGGIILIPVLAFSVFLVMGVLYGIGTGGSLVIALWESRPIFYLPVMIVLTSNLITKKEHVLWVMWFCLAAIFLEGINGTYAVIFILNWAIHEVNSLTQHSAAIHANTYFVFMVATWLYRTSFARAVWLLALTPPILITYLAAQRRSAFITLAIALFILGVILFKEHRKIFFMLAPIVFFVGIAYLGVFWNSGGALGLPAQAIKSIIAPDAGSLDEQSNIYRYVENFNVNFTVHQKPLTGVGFGQKFYIVIPMADISFFDWWEYIVHNSIFWIWLKTGVFGFISMLYLFGLSIMTGARVIWRLQDGELSVAATTATLYVMMHALYAYVDMSWDSQSMIYMGLMIGLINTLEHIASQPVKLAKRRWPWQPEVKPAPLLAIPQS